MANLQVILDNMQFPADNFAGLDGVKTTIRAEDEEGRVAKSYSGDLTLLKAAFDYVKANIIDNPAGHLVTMDVQFIDTCCNLPFFLGQIKGADIEWCEGECEAKVSVTEKTPELDCFNTYVIWRGNKQVVGGPTGFDTQTHPRVTYCNEPRPLFVYFVLVILGAIFYLMLLWVTPIVAIIAFAAYLICKFKTLFGGDCPQQVDDNLLTDWIDMLKELDDRILGCGFKHPTPKLRDYINNVCTICGLTFKSSILTDIASPYYDTLYFHAPMAPGTFNSNVKMIEENKPNLTGGQLMNEISPVHNAKWRIIGNDLVYERRDFFENGTIWIDFTTIDPDRIIEQCYDFTGDQIPSEGQFLYQADAADAVGVEAANYYSIAAIDWNPANNPALTGVKELLLIYSPARFMSDGIAANPLQSPLIKVNPIYASEANEYKDVLIMDHGRSMSPKLLIWDEDRGGNNARIKRYPGVGGSNGFNYPYVFEEIPGEAPAQYSGNTLQMTVKKNLYHNFHHIDDPNLSSFKTRNVKITFKYECQDLLTLNINKNVIIPFSGGTKEVTIEQIEVDPDKQQITINGKV